MSNKVIWWIRRDLRLEDNPTLKAACEQSNHVIPLFIRDPALEASPYVGRRRLDFLYQALADLDNRLRQLGSRLVVRSGQPSSVLPALVAAHDIQHIFAEADYTPYARQRDQKLLETQPLTLIDGVAIRPVGQVCKKDGGPYTVFTPFSKSWKGLPLPTEKQLLPTPDSLAEPEIDSEGLPAPQAEFSAFPPSAAAAQARLDDFVSDEIFSYGRERDRVAIDGTSSLSPYLRFGLISARAAAVAALRAKARAKGDHAYKSADSWLTELIWRDFYINILYHFPRARLGNFRPVYDNIQWRDDQEQFAAWCAGQTGYPIVDAAMRQLNELGWMHNRARMIVASFLVKDLLINWQWGERYFMQQLLDGDPAANNGGWQWSAGTGTDAAPYFRIFNPTSQGKKHDPDGTYVRRWVPELADVPDKFIHAPWEMNAAEQARYNCMLGEDYPRPIVDHKGARERTLAAYKAARDAD